MIDYEYYQTIYGKSNVKDRLEFNRLLLTSKALLNNHTFCRYNKVVDEDVRDMVKLTLCQLIDLSSSTESEGNIKSESIDDVSFTYNLTDANYLRNKQLEIIENNLANTGLLYRGISSIVKGRRVKGRRFF